MPLPGVLEALLDYEKISKAFNTASPDWELFQAVESEFHPPLPVGNTPLVRARRLGANLGIDRLWIKNDALNPSGSLKDRASFLMLAEARRLGEKRIIAASTGNAASALATLCASTDREAIIFVPEKAPKAKLVQILLCGARVITIKGTYDDAFQLSLEFTRRHGGLNRNTAYHPLTIEGKKTAGLEIWGQLGFQAPDAIFIPTGDGVILAGIHKAFIDLKRAGLIEKLPRLFAIQAGASDAIYRYVESGQYKNAHSPTTIADSISVACPSNAHWARRAILDTKGKCLLVSDEEILVAQNHLARLSGLFAEPAAAASLAGLVKMKRDGVVGQEDNVVLLLTGHGLKDLDAVRPDIRMPKAIKPTMEALEEVVSP